MKSLDDAKGLTSKPLMAAAQPQGGRPQMGQPQMGGPLQQNRQQRAPDLSQSLGKYSLPSRPVTDKDIPGIKAVIDGTCNMLSGAVIKSDEQKVDYETIKSGIFALQGWLKRQGCIDKASTTYDIETADKYSDNIFLTFPGQLPFDIDFKMEGNTKKPYRLLIFVSRGDFLRFGSLVENTSISGVPFPQSWPRDALSYWEDKL